MKFCLFASGRGRWAVQQFWAKYQPKVLHQSFLVRHWSYRHGEQEQGGQCLISQWNVSMTSEKTERSDGSVLSIHQWSDASWCSDWSAIVRPLRNRKAGHVRALRNRKARCIWPLRNRKARCIWPLRNRKAGPVQPFCCFFAINRHLTFTNIM